MTRGRTLTDDTIMTEILHLKTVVLLTGRSRSSLWRDVKSRRFPAPLRIGKNRIGWRKDEIFTWLESLPRVWQPTAEVEGPETGDEGDKPAPATASEGAP